MSLSLTQNAAETEVTETAETASIARPENTEFFGEDLANKAPDAMQKAIEYAEAHKLPVRSNFNAEEEFPANYGLAIRVLTKSKKEIGIVIAAIPEVDLIAEDEEQGAPFIHQTIQRALISKAIDAIRPRGDDMALGSVMPVTVAQFIAPAPRGEGIGAFNELAKHILPTIKKSVPTISKVLLRQALSNRQFAEQTFPAIPQETWVGVLDVLSKLANKYGENAEIFKQWKETRDSAVVQTADIDLGALDTLAGDDESEADTL